MLTRKESVRICFLLICLKYEYSVKSAILVVDSPSFLDTLQVETLQNCHLVFSLQTDDNVTDIKLSISFKSLDFADAKETMLSEAFSRSLDFKLAPRCDIYQF